MCGWLWQILIWTLLLQEFDTPVEYELYNIDEDPFEMKNIYGTEEADQTLVSLGRKTILINSFGGKFCRWMH